MSSKNISVRDDVYRELAEEKADDESFSDAIHRLITARRGEHPLYDLVGMLDEEDAERVRQRAQEFRERMDQDIERYS